jgi:uncharacterized repeat protein (TIGR03809 family)
MIDGPAHRRFTEIAQKWRDLVEKRRDHYAELYQSGRWRTYFVEEDFVRQTRVVAGLIDRWAKLAPRPGDDVTRPTKPVTTNRFGRTAA